jgi:hypothetical protein
MSFTVNYKVIESSCELLYKKKKEVKCFTLPQVDILLCALRDASCSALMVQIFTQPTTKLFLNNNLF